MTTIGGEGQYLVGAVTAMAIVTADGIRDLPTPLLIPIGVLAGIVGGGRGGSSRACWRCGSARASIVGVITALIVVFVVVGDALAERYAARR